MRMSDWSSDVCFSDLVDAVIGDAALREIVGADAFRAVARADHRAARARAFGVQALAFGLVEPGAQDAERLGLVLVLRFLVLLDDDEAGGQMGDAHRRIGGVDRLADGPGRDRKSTRLNYSH